MFIFSIQRHISRTHGWININYFLKQYSNNNKNVFNSIQIAWKKKYLRSLLNTALCTPYEVHRHKFRLRAYFSYTFFVTPRNRNVVFARINVGNDKYAPHCFYIISLCPHSPLNYYKEHTKNDNLQWCIPLKQCSV